MYYKKAKELLLICMASAVLTSCGNAVLVKEDSKSETNTIVEGIDDSEDNNLQNVYNAYADYLENNPLYEGFEVGEYETYETKLAFSLVYIDEDDIPELIIGWTKLLANTSDICILKYVDGNIISSGPIGHYNSISYIPRKNVLNESNYNLGICSNWYGYLNDKGELSTHCESYEECPEGESLGFTYYVKGEEVNEDEYNNYYDSVIEGEFTGWSGNNSSNTTYILNEESLELLRSGKVEIDDPSKESNHPEVEAYSELLKGMLQDVDEPLRVALITIDNDNTYELAVFQGNAHIDGALLYSYRDNEVVSLAIDGFPEYGSYGSFELLPNLGMISYSYDRNGGAGEYRFYLSLANGKMTLDKGLQADITFTEDGELKENKYYWDGQEITGEEYESIIESYEASLSDIVDYDSCYEIMKEEDIPEALSQEYYSID